MPNRSQSKRDFLEKPVEHSGPDASSSVALSGRQKISILEFRMDLDEVQDVVTRDDADKPAILDDRQPA